MECVVHYNLKDTEYSDLRILQKPNIKGYWKLRELGRTQLSKSNLHSLFQVIENVNQNYRQEHLNEIELMRHRPQHCEYFQRSVLYTNKVEKQ